MRNHRVSYCIISAPDGLPEQIGITTNTGYVRKKDLYQYDFSKKEIKDWSKKFKDLHARSISLYFNNDAEGNARLMKKN